jgi:NADH-quinone oxidoreductase subunit C
MSEVSDDTTLAAEDGSDETSRSYGCVTSESCGQTVLHPTRDQYVDVVKTLADEGFTVVIDLCGVDYLEHLQRPLPPAVARERFEVVVNLLDITHRRRIRLRVQVPESDPTLPSLFDIHPGTEAHERETYDMFGVVFTDHPDMTRILMPEDWIGHPLRKDYAVGEIPVQFKGANS